MGKIFSLSLIFLFLGCVLNSSSEEQTTGSKSIRERLVFDAVVYGCSPPKHGNVDILLGSQDGQGGKILFKNALLRSIQPLTDIVEATKASQARQKVFRIETLVETEEAKAFHSLGLQGQTPEVYITLSNEVGKVGRDPARLKPRSS